MKKKTGSISVEASLTFPFFIIMIIFCIFIGKIAYTAEKIQYALDETTSQLASYSYLYYVTGISAYEKDNTTDANLFDSIVSSTEKVIKADDKSSEISNELKKIMVTALSQGIKNELFDPYIKLNIKKYLNISDSIDSNALEKKFYIMNSFSGLDLSNSSILQGGTGDIRLQADYYMSCPVFTSLLPKIRMQNISVQKPWLGGDKITSGNENVWLLPPFERGKKIQIIFGENLPDSLPVSIFENGTVIRITSIDLTLPYASSGEYLYENITGHINKLINFNGCKTSETEILPESILKRKLIVVIPENSITKENENVFADLKNYAVSKGVTLEIIPYQKKPENNLPESGGN